MRITRKPVDWAYEVWDDLLEELTRSNHYLRSGAAQYLAQLAISDSENRILEDFSAISQVTRDERIVTAPHNLQAIGRVRLAGTSHKDMVMN